MKLKNLNEMIEWERNCGYGDAQQKIRSIEIVLLIVKKSIYRYACMDGKYTVRGIAKWEEIQCIFPHINSSSCYFSSSTSLLWHPPLLQYLQNSLFSKSVYRKYDFLFFCFCFSVFYYILSCKWIARSIERCLVSFCSYYTIISVVFGRYIEW